MSAVAQRTTAISRMVGELRQLGGLRNVDLANIMGVSPPTVHRWSKGQGSPTIEKQQIIAELRWVTERLSDFYEPDEARLWLQTGHPQLNGEKPYDLINEDRTAEVLEIIERLESGVYL